VLVLSSHLEVEYAASVLRAATGGLGYLLKDRVLEPATLVDGLRRVVAGECVVDPAIVVELMRTHLGSDSFADLSPRELEVLAGIAEGLTNVGIARRLSISDRTVEVHVNRVFMKLGVPTEVESNRRVLAA
jgi:serine/threonine-protein kinase